MVFRAMRFNELSEQWNVDVVVTNAGAQTFSGLIILTIDAFTGTTGPLRPDGVSLGNPSVPFFQMALPLGAQGAFSPGTATTPRTISLGFIDGQSAPRLTTKVFVQPVGEAFALALTRTLDSLGQPLVIDGLWALRPGNGGTGGFADQVYFTAGPDGEANGLFGTLVPIGTPVPTPEPSTCILVGSLLLPVAWRRFSNRHTR